MTYEEKLNEYSHFTMDDFIKVSKELLPHKFHVRPWTYIDHGVGLLSTEEELCAYIVAYGEMHSIKCRAAFQNFNFDSIDTSVEIIDWGCGQGVGALTFVDMLRERDKLKLLKRVTLIEPSLIALNRATINMQKATNGSVLVLPINKYLPGNGTVEEIDGVDYVHTNVVHIFSNILDIPSVNIEKLAYLVGTPSRVHHIMCMGPKNTNSYRIDKFCSAFNVDMVSYFSRIDSPCYSQTSDTYHNFSCVTRCLKYAGEGISLNNMENFVEPTLVCGRPILDDYDPLLAVQNKIISKELCEFYTYLGGKLNKNDHVYLRPNINGDTPDIVILRPNTGIMLIKVFEEDINTLDFCKNDNNTLDYHHLTDGENEQTSPINIVQSYQQNLIQLHMEDMLSKSLVDSVYWSVIKTVVYFSKNSTAEVDEKFKNAPKRYTTILGKDIINNSNFNLLKETKFNFSSKYFDETISNSFLRIISPQWHSYKQGKHTTLTPVQRRLSKSEPYPRRKINGVAGSGKTQVLATRAVNAHLRTGDRVLVLTFNLSLVNYIRYRIGQVRADFSWNKFFIINYHQFFIAEANNHGLKMNLSSFEDTSFFECVSQKIKKFSTILIDEVQDYQTSWLNILEKYFLEPGGEIVVFGDAKQNIYHRRLDQNGQIRIGFIPGEWNNSLNTGFRFINPQLTSLALNFQREFFPSLAMDIIQQETALSFDTCIKYSNLGRIVDVDMLERYCRGIMDRFNINPKDVVVLSQTCDILQELDYVYRSRTGHGTMTTFESKEQLENLKKHHKISTSDSPITFRFKDDIKQIRRNKKVHFSMDTMEMKLSTIHSYKGWESPSVILILEPEQSGEDSQYTIRPAENAPELIYTAITRCKENLFVINYGNERYHSFFNNFCNQ